MGDLQLPDELRDVIDRQVAQGRAASTDAYVAEAIRRYAEDLDAEGELVAIAPIALEGDHVSIRPAARPRYTLQELLDQCAADDPGATVDDAWTSGTAVGIEEI